MDCQLYLTLSLLPETVAGVCGCDDGTEVGRVGGVVGLSFLYVEWETCESAGPPSRDEVVEFIPELLTLAWSPRRLMLSSGRIS